MTEYKKETLQRIESLIDSLKPHSNRKDTLLNKKRLYSSKRVNSNKVILDYFHKESQEDDRKYISYIDNTNKNTNNNNNNNINKTYYRERLDIDNYSNYPFSNFYDSEYKNIISNKDSLLRDDGNSMIPIASQFNINNENEDEDEYNIENNIYSQYQKDSNFDIDSKILASNKTIYNYIDKVNSHERAIKVNKHSNDNDYIDFSYFINKNFNSELQSAKHKNKTESKQESIIKYITSKSKSILKWESLPDIIFSEILKYLSIHEIVVLEYISRTWRSYAKHVYDIYERLPNYELSTQKLNGEMKLKLLLKKTKGNIISQLLSSIIRLDYGDSIRNFLNRTIFYMKVSCLLQSSFKKGVLLESFKIRPVQNKETFISNASIIKVLNSSLYSLLELTLKGCIKITNGIVSSLSKCLSLRKLDISDNYSIDYYFIDNISKNCKEISYLSLSNCMNIDDSSLKCLNELRKLIALDITYCKNITSKGLFYLKECIKLKKLLISNVKISQQDMRFIIYLKELNTLMLDNCGLNNKSFDFLYIMNENENENTYSESMKCLSKLENLSIQNNSELNEEMIFNLVNIIKSLLKVIVDSRCSSKRIEERLTKNKYNYLI